MKSDGVVVGSAVLNIVFCGGWVGWPCGAVVAVELATGGDVAVDVGLLDEFVAVAVDWDASVDSGEAVGVGVSVGSGVSVLLLDGGWVAMT